MSLKKRFLKSRPVCQVTFRLPLEAASQAKEVVLLGDFNNWDQNNGFPMKKTKSYFLFVINKAQLIHLPFKLFKTENEIKFIETILKRKGYIK